MFYILGSYIINKNDNYIKEQKNFITFKVVSPNFDIQMNSVQKNIENNLKKIIRYSDPVSDKETFLYGQKALLLVHIIVTY